MSDKELQGRPWKRTRTVKRPERLTPGSSNENRNSEEQETSSNEDSNLEEPRNSRWHKVVPLPVESDHEQTETDGEPDDEDPPDAYRQAAQLFFDHFIDVSCGPYTLLHLFNLTPKRWETEKLIVFENGKEHISTCYVEMGPVLQRVALLNGVKHCFFSVKEANRRDIRITHETIYRTGRIAVIDRLVVFRNKSLGLFLAVDRSKKNGRRLVTLNRDFDSSLALADESDTERPTERFHVVIFIIILFIILFIIYKTLSNF